MLNIAICDDEKVQRNILKDMLYKICNKNNMDMKRLQSTDMSPKEPLMHTTGRSSKISSDSSVRS